MKQKLYHASLALHANGTVLLGKARSILDANAWIEDEFERGRVGRSVSRIQAMFATGDPTDSIKYLKVQQNFGNEPIYLYRVEMPSPHRHPMALVDVVKRNQAEPDRLKDIVEKYWLPSQDWQFWEYLDCSMTIIETLSEPDFTMVAGAGQRYLADHVLAGQLWPPKPKLDNHPPKTEVGH